MLPVQFVIVYEASIHPQDGSNIALGIAMRMLIFFILMSWIYANAQSSEQSLRQPLFSTDETLQVKMTAPFSGTELNSQLQLEEENEKFPKVAAQMETRTADGRNVTLQVQLRLRGKDRLASCKFPPLKISFKETDKGIQDQTIFRGLKELKLVTHCNRQRSHDPEHPDDLTVGPQAVRQEYLSYKILQKLTPLSFGVKYAEITYVDSLRKMKTFKREALFLEGESDIAARVGLRKLETEFPNTTPDAMSFARTGLFQSLIGNSDYSTWRNAIVLLNEKDNTLFSVPYDLDRAISFRVSRFSPIIEISSDSYSCEDMLIQSMRQMQRDQQTQLILEFKNLASQAQKLINEDLILAKSQKRPMINFYAGFAKWLIKITDQMKSLNCK